MLLTDLYTVAMVDLEINDFCEEKKRKARISSRFHCTYKDKKWKIEKYFDFFFGKIRFFEEQDSSFPKKPNFSQNIQNISLFFFFILFMSVYFFAFIFFPSQKNSIFFKKNVISKFERIGNESSFKNSLKFNDWMNYLLNIIQIKCIYRCGFCYFT